MRRDLHRRRSSAWIACGKAQRVHGCMPRILEDQRAFHDLRKYGSQPLEKEHKYVVHSCNLHDRSSRVAEEICLLAFAVKTRLPFLGSENRRQSLRPQAVRRRIFRHHAICPNREREQNPQVNRLGSRDRLDGRPVDIHAIGIEKHDRALAAPVLGSAPLLQPGVGVFLLDGAALRKRGELGADEFSQRGRMLGLILDEDIAVELVIDGKRLAHAAFLIPADLFVVIAEQARIRSALAGLAPSRACEGVDVEGFQLAGARISLEDELILDKIIAQGLKLALGPRSSKTVRHKRSLRNRIIAVYWLYVQ